MWIPSIKRIIISTITMQNTNQDEMSSTFYCTTDRTVVEEADTKHQLPAKTSNKSDDDSSLTNNEEGNIGLNAKEGARLPSSSGKRSQENRNKERFFGNFSFSIHLISGYSGEKKRFEGSSGISQTISLERFTKNSVASRTFDPDGCKGSSEHPAVKLSRLCLDIGSGRFQDSTSLHQGMCPSAPTLPYHRHRTDIPPPSDFPLEPFPSTDHRGAIRALNNNANCHLPKLNTHNVSCASDLKDPTVPDGLKGVDKANSSLFQQQQSSHITSTEEDQPCTKIDSNSACSDSTGEDMHLMHCYNEKISTEKPAAHVNSLKILKKKDWYRKKIYSFKKILADGTSSAIKINEKELTLCDLPHSLFTGFTNVPIKAGNITRLNEKSSLPKAFPKVLENKVFMLGNNASSCITFGEPPLSNKSIYNTQRPTLNFTDSKTAACSVIDIRMDENAKQLVRLDQNMSSNYSLTFSSEMKYVQKSKKYNFYEYSNTKSNWGFKSEADTYSCSPKFLKSIKSVQKLGLPKKRSNPNAFLAAKKKKKLEENFEKEMNVKRFDFESENNICGHKDSFDLPINSDEDYSSSEDFLENEDLLALSDIVHDVYEEENFYDTFEDLENALTTNPRPIDEDDLEQNVFSTIRNKVTSTTLLFEEPIIFKYVNDDTSEVDEIMIYPKDFMENVKKTCGRNLTRKEILPKLIEESKFYDGKPIGIVTNVRGVRKDIENKGVSKRSENVASASIGCSEKGEAASSRWKGVRFKNSKKPQIPIYINKKNVKVSEKMTGKAMSQAKHSTTKLKSYAEPKTSSASIPWIVDKLNTPDSNENESHRQMGGDTSQVLFKVPDRPASPHPKYKSNKGEGDQLRNPKDENAISSTSSPVRKLDITPFKQSTFYAQPKSTQLISQQSKRFSTFNHLRHTQSAENVCKKPWGSANRTTSTRPQVVVRRTLNRHQQQLTILNCLNGVVHQRSSRIQEEHQTTCLHNLEDDSGSSSGMAIQRYNCSGSKQDLRIPMRRNMSAEDVVCSDFRKFFSFYAKIGRRFKSGSAMSKANSSHWMRVTGVVYDVVSEQIAEKCFDNIARRKLVLNIYDYVQYLIAVSRQRKVWLYELVQQLKSVKISEEAQLRRVSYVEVETCTINKPLPSRSPFTLSSLERASYRHPSVLRTSKMASATPRKT